MKKTVSLLVVALLLVFGTGIFSMVSAQEPMVLSDEKPILAVLDFTSNAMNGQTLSGLTDIIRNKATETGQYVVLSRSEVLERLASRNVVLRECISVACLTKAGGVLKANYVIGGTINMIGNMYVINIQFVNAQSGQSWKAITNRMFSGTVEALAQEMDRTGSELFGIQQQPVAVAPEPPRPVEAAPLAEAPAPQEPITPLHKKIRYEIGFGFGPAFLMDEVAKKIYSSVGTFNIYAKFCVWEGLFISPMFMYQWASGEPIVDATAYGTYQEPDVSGSSTINFSHLILTGGYQWRRDSRIQPFVAGGFDYLMVKETADVTMSWPNGAAEDETTHMEGNVSATGLVIFGGCNFRLAGPFGLSLAMLLNTGSAKREGEGWDAAGYSSDANLGSYNILANIVFMW